jgi:hypothetical protein
MLHHPASPPAPDRVLLVADWNVDPQAVVDAARSRHQDAGMALLVPARLHGLDWVGDPYASVPCAQLQLDRITELAGQAGLTFARAGVGDPEPLAAICDALAAWPVDHLMVCGTRGRIGVPRPFDLRTRARRLSVSATVEWVDLPAASSAARRRTWLSLRGGHCALEQPHAA